MITRFRQQNDASILDAAAAVLARQGLAKTSVQDIADAVGLSKAGLLHHFPTKDAIHQAILEQVDALAGAALDQLCDVPAGVDRDLQVVEVMVDAALAHPGVVALMMLSALRGEPPPGGRPASSPEVFIRALFGDDPADPGVQRQVRTGAALATLAVLSLSTPPDHQTTAWRRALVATSFDALGHRRPSASPVVPTPLEA